MDILPDFNAARILVVEDDLPTAERMVKVLRGAGYSVQNAYNSGDAIAADHSRFDLALVDGAMRDRDGRSILDSIKQHPTFARLPILAVTDTPNVSASTTALQRSASDAELLDRIEQLIGHTPKNEQPASKPVAEREAAALKPVEPPSLEDLPTKPTRLTFDAHLQQQLGELKTLSSLGRSISSVLDLSEVLNEIVEAATALTHAEEGLLLLPDEERKALYIRAMKGVDDNSARNFRVKTEDALVGRVYKTGEPILVGDKGWQRVKTEYFVKSLLYVPMTYKGQTIGVLGVNNRLVERVFTVHDQELLLDLAAHAAIAIENARLYEESLLRNRQLTMLVDAGKAINSTLALQDVLMTLCKQTVHALDVNGCVISRYDADSKEIRPLAVARQGIWRAEDGPKVDLGQRPMVKEALSQNAFFVVKRDQKGGKWQEERQNLSREGAEGMVMVPIRSGNQPAIGILELYYRGSLPEVTSEFRTRARSAALEVLPLIMHRKGSLPLAGIFSSAQKILESTGASFIILSLLPGDQLVKVIDYGMAAFVVEPYPPQSIFPVNMAVFGDGKALGYHVREATLPDLVRAAMVEYGSASLLCLPLMIKGNPFGTVTIYDTLEARRFRTEEISLAWTLIGQAAAAIENARLYQDLQQSLSELRQAQASLVQAARLSTMGELAAVVAHQINNPLTTIMVDAELILQDLGPGDPMYEGLTAIYRSGQRAHNVVKRLLSTARRSSPGDPLQWIPVHETVHHTLELVTTHIERSKVSLKIELDEVEPAYVKGAPGHLEDLWLNLLLNARDALQDLPDATITIRSRRRGETLEVEIRDNGSGIPAEIQEAIFEPFFTTKPPGEGTGLGLYICKQIVDQCGGKIDFETAPGKGTCFRVSLPVRSQNDDQN